MREVVSRAISNGDSINPILVSVLESFLDTTKNGIVVLNSD
jgi:hypothetical protein